MTGAWQGESLLEQATAGAAVDEAAQRLFEDGADLEVLGKLEDFLQALHADPSLRDRALLLVERTRVLAERGVAGAERSQRLRADASQLRTGGADGATGMLHHELSTSLTVAGMALEMVSESGHGPRASELVAVARRHVRLAGRLLETWGRAERLHAGRADLSWTEVDLGEVVRECVGDVGLVRADAHEFTLSVKRRLVVPGDADALRQVVLNLLTNAAKFSPGASRIEVTVAESGAHAEVAVRDHGPGVSTRDAERIFEAGQRVDVEAPGLGFGLFVARQLARAHGGELHVADAAPGARFVLRIPLSGADWRGSLGRREDAIAAQDARQQRRDAVADDRDAELDQRERVAAMRDDALDALDALARDRNVSLDQREAHASARDEWLDTREQVAGDREAELDQREADAPARGEEGLDERRLRRDGDVERDEHGEA